MTNKYNRYASFLLPTIFYKFHASKHIMILRYFKGKKIFKYLGQLYRAEIHTVQDGWMINWDYLYVTESRQYNVWVLLVER